ncbi:MAG: secreted protein [Acidobacteria bacterium]|nr:secreted protein [Acidobacteriota bacterium]
MRIVASLLALLTAAFVQAPPAPPTRVLNSHFPPGGPRYEYLPFDVPAGTESLTISYAFSGDNGSSVIDLGLFEPGPLTLGTPAFRGYSGGSQRSITIARNTASAGYRTGPLPAGQWHVLLGMYKVAPAGVDVQVRIDEGRDEPPPAAAARPNTTAGRAGDRSSTGRAKTAWYAGALHLHTLHSDGSLTPGGLADAARLAGFDFIAITDHNNTTHTREALPPSPLHIVGEEITTPAGHADVWGLPRGGWIDFRVGPTGPGAAAAINGLVAAAHSAGALFAINHPIDNCAGCSWDQVIPDNVDAVEIWQNDKAPRDAAIAFWDRLLRTGRHVTAVGVADWHRPPARIDMAAVRVLAASLTQPDILDGIRNGRVIVMRDAATTPPSVRAACGSRSAGIGDTLSCSASQSVTMTVDAPGFHDGRADFIWNAARMTSQAIGRGALFSMPASAGYLRAHVYAADGSPVAITNPVYVEIR